MLDSLTLDAIATMNQKIQETKNAINCIEYPKFAVSSHEPGFVAYLNACDRADNEMRRLRAVYDLQCDVVGYMQSGNFQHAAIVLVKISNMI